MLMPPTSQGSPLFSPWKQRPFWMPSFGTSWMQVPPDGHSESIAHGVVALLLHLPAQPEALSDQRDC